MAKIVFGESLRKELMEGVRDTCRLVGTNYGPLGGNTLVQPKLDIPMFLNSGAKLLESLALEQPVPEMGSRMLRDSVLTLCDHTGSGASSTVVLCNALLEAGNKVICAGANPVHLGKGMLLAARKAADAIWSKAESLDADTDIYALALHTTQDEETAEILASAWQQADNGSPITIEDSRNSQTQIHSGGIRYEYGWMAPEFTNDETGTCAKLWNPYVLLVDKRIDDIYELQSILESVSQKKVPLLMIVRDMKPEILRVILMNVKRKTANIVVATAPGHGDSRRRHMEALAARLGAALIDEHWGQMLKGCGLEVCGRVEYAQISKDQTILRGIPAGDTEKLTVLQHRALGLLEETTDEYEREKVQMTLSILAGQTITITVGGVTEVAMFEQKQRLEAGLASLLTARDTGTLPGGGKAFLLGLPQVEICIRSLEGDAALGAQCVREALSAPLKTITCNAGISSGIVLENLQRSNELFYGYDITQQSYVNLRKAGILDPAGTVVGALLVAAETAATILTAEAAIYPGK